MEQNEFYKFQEDEFPGEQWALIEKARNEIREGKYYTYDEVKKHFENKFERN